MKSFQITLIIRRIQAVRGLDFKLHKRFNWTFISIFSSGTLTIPSDRFHSFQESYLQIFTREQLTVLDRPKINNAFHFLKYVLQYTSADVFNYCFSSYNNIWINLDIREICYTNAKFRIAELYLQNLVFQGFCVFILNFRVRLVS